MKKNLKFPTILGVFVLVFGLIAGIYIVNLKQDFKLGATASSSPKNVRISNVSDTTVTVTWTTDLESNGFVKWGKKESSTSNVSLEESSEKSFVHSVNISLLDSNSNIFIVINSDNKDYTNNGVAWQTKTSSNKPSQNNSLIASGSVLLSDGKTPAKSLVYLTVNGILLSGLTSDNGNFVIPFSKYIDGVDDNNPIEITVNAGTNGTSQAVIYPKSIKAIPTIILGKTYDFRSLLPDNTNEVPQSSLSVPSSVEISSRFEVTRNEALNNVNTPTIESVDNGEIINTTNPEFFGKGPKNSELKVEVESELQETSLITDSKGTWKWSPPKNLEPGEHKVTLKWRDATGVLREITRTFIVQASEGPAFESTPSATPTIIASSTPTSTSSATPRASKTPTTTAPPTPETGSLTPTIGLFIMGMGILLSSIIVYKKSYA